MKFKVGLLDWNHLFFRSSRLVGYYRSIAPKGLEFPEQYCLDLVPQQYRRAILDIGIGAGRTTKALSTMFTTYVGIDYSEPMVAVARSVHAGVDLRVMDARRLQLERSFDCVMFSYNGIDMVDHADRRTIIDNIAHVLIPGGYFIYSTHNLGYRHVKQWLAHFFVRELIESWRGVILGVPNRLRNFHKQWVDETRGMAVVNDPAHRFSLLAVFVDIPTELAFLADHGFSTVDTVGASKRNSGYDADDHWVYVIARKE